MPRAASVASSYDVLLTECVVPVTVKLSKAFYERFGEDIVNELVELLNVVDATYRSELREINELNFARFDAKMEQRFAQLETKLEQRFAHSDTKLEQRLALLEARIHDRLDRRLDTQTRLIVLSWATMIAAIVAIAFR